MAATFVIITHSAALLGRGEGDALAQLTGGALQFNHLGVAIFFTISGFLITQSALVSKSAKGYLARRFLRIIPGLLIALLLSAFVLGPIVTTMSCKEYFSDKATYLHLLSVSLYKLFLNLPGVFSNNPTSKAVNGSLWTLAYEFSLYFAVLFISLAGLIKQKKLLLGVVLLAFVFRIYLWHRYFVYNYSTPFLLGLNIMYLTEWSFYFGAGLLFFLFKERIVFDVKILIVLVVIYAAAILLNIDFARIINYILIPYSVFYFSFLKSRLNRFGEYGDFSYGMYIYAFPVQQTIVHYTHASISTGMMIILSVLSTFPLAVLSWHLIEKRALRLKRFFE
jgi:peptidoglycan/LPS O-acetylase OafA/YrhL